MEKLLICDICGTSYADTEEKCPTCGYARAFDFETLYSERPSVTHTKVRGGRYSKKNVMKRLKELEEQGKAAQAELEMQSDVEQEPAEQVVEASTNEETIVPAEEAVTDLEKVAAAAEALVTIPEQTVAEIEEAFPAEPVAEAIDFKFPEEESQENDPEQEEELVLEVPEEIGFKEELPQEPEEKPKGRNLWLNLVLGFASVVFILSAMYLVVKYAVPAVKEMLPPTEPTVVATEAPTTEPAEAETAVPTVGDEVLSLNYNALTFIRAEATSKIFAVGIADQAIVWSSDNAEVASVDETGLVTAVGPGTTTIRAAYGEQEAVVVITCAFE